jgi:hypothetical protein
MGDYFESKLGENVAYIYELYAIVGQTVKKQTKNK